MIPIGSRQAMIQVMIWRQTTNDYLVHWHIYAALGGDESNKTVFSLPETDQSFTESDVNAALNTYVLCAFD